MCNKLEIIVAKNKLVLFCLIISIFLFQLSCKREPDKYINVTGTVLNEQTKIPIGGLYVSLSQATGSSSFGTGGGWSVIATKMTDNNGNYSFSVKVNGPANWKIDINSNPYNSKYSTNWFSVTTEKNYISTIYIYKNATLTASASTNNPLGPNDSFYINLPGIGCKCNYLTTIRAKGEAFNIVSWSVTRNNTTSIFKDSIYCSSDTTKLYLINY